MAAEMFGGYDINGQWQPNRMQADPGAAEITHRSGRVAPGRARGLGEVAILADAVFNIVEEHYDFRQWVIRNRIREVHRNYANHVIWRRKGNPPDYSALRFDTMNEWLGRVEADASGRTLREKIVASKPAGAVDQCWRSGAGWSTDPVVCNTGAVPSMASSVTGSGAYALYTPTDDEWPVFRDTRVAAGEDLTSDIMKCQLKPLARGDYKVGFSDAQWARMQALFPQGVCDYLKAGVGQVEPEAWQTFMDGPWGRAPVSKAGNGLGI